MRISVPTSSAGVQRCLSLRHRCLVLCGGLETCELVTQMVLVRGYSEVPVTQMVFVRGYRDVCTSDAAGACAGVQRKTVLATQRVCISL